jgi:2-polyprenyl-3-methyl-5-hydroxy-6-metoxy-1,4-benzoquinol methylase
MNSDQFNDGQIIDSWHANAAPWTAAVRQGQIESRLLVTDRAIVEAVVSRAPKLVLDIGCGEGWLVRALAAHDIRALGVDIVPSLIEQAQQAGGGEFRIASYEQIAAGVTPVCADVVVCNFALLGKQSVEGLMRAMPRLLRRHGTLAIQTLHPLSACGEHPYRDGWRDGSWAGLDAAFTHPAPWYFRTLGSWLKLLADHRLRILEMREPLHPLTQRPASVIFMAALEPALGPADDI